MSATSSTSDSGDSTPETTAKWRARNSADQPPKFEYNITFSPDLLVADYGVKEVNVYQAKYAPDDEMIYWEDNWLAWEYAELTWWSVGHKFQAHDENHTLHQADAVTSKENIQNVRLASLSEFEGCEGIASTMNIPVGSKILCWTYEIKDFPTQCFSEYRVYDVPEDFHEIQFGRISAQFVDGLPTYGRVLHASRATYEWPDVVPPSRIARPLAEEGRYMVNPSHTLTFEPSTTKYTVGTAIQTNLPVVDPKTCMDEIKRALEYEPVIWGTNDGVVHIWENNIEVYCMELTYVALDSTTSLTEEGLGGDYKKNDLYLVPAWEVHFVISDPEQTGVYDGELLLNAVTGKSLYSDNYGDEENVDLYPDLKDPC